MNWDWDKLQEKRQRQNWGNNNNNSNNNEEEPPFGSGSGNGGRGPDYEKLSDAFKRLPHLSAPAGGKAKWILVALVAVWLLSGIYIVNPDEEGVVLRFGKYDRTVGAGPHYALPFPIETVYKPKVTQVQRVEVGFRSVGQGRTFQQGANRSLPEEASMLTGDENIVNVQFSVQYQIKNPVEYLFNVTDQAAVVKNAAEAAMREVIGNSLIDSALTDGKLQIQTEATQLLQEILDRYKVGVRVIAVQLQDVHPPKEVSDAFKDVASAARTEPHHQRSRAYRNELIPKARGLAAEVENQAQAYKEPVSAMPRAKPTASSRSSRSTSRPRTSRSSACILKPWKKSSAAPAWKNSFFRRTPPIACCRFAAHAARPVRRKDCRPKNTFPGDGSRNATREPEPRGGIN